MNAILPSLSVNYGSVAPLRVMAAEVAHVCRGMHKSWKHTLVPVLTGRFVDIGDSESSNLNDVTEV